MVDEIYDRAYQVGRSDLHGGIERLIRSVANGLSVTFDTLHRIEWDAPWNARSNDKAKA